MKSDTKLWNDLKQQFLTYLKIQNYSEATRETYLYTLNTLNMWLKKNRVTPLEFNLQYAEDLILDLVKSGKYGDRTPVSRFSELKIFFAWLKRKKIVLQNPFDALASPKFPRRKFQPVLTHHEIYSVLCQPNTKSTIGLRDRTILELFYATGVRRSELVAIERSHLDISAETLFIFRGKGKRQRYVPLSSRSVKWIQKYLEISRPKLDLWSSPFLFLNRYGQPIRAKYLSTRIKFYLRSANLRKNGSCHIFRRSLATSLLDAGVDLRLIQDLLGHTNLVSTETYLQFSIKHLKDIHQKNHPAP